MLVLLRANIDCFLLPESQDEGKVYSSLYRLFKSTSVTACLLDRFKMSTVSLVTKHPFRIIQGAFYSIYGSQILVLLLLERK